MRLIHTADWHIGKSLKGVSMLDEQSYLLGGSFLDLVDDWQPDAIIIAGDVYDRGVPPVDAVDLLDEIFSKLAERKIPLLCIAGNHDSSSRLNFASRILSRTKFFMAAKISAKPAPVVLEDEDGEVYFSLVPFFLPVELRETFSAETFPENFSANDANKFYIETARKKIPAGKRSVAVAHLFVSGGKTSQSERKFVGGTENVSVEIFSGYNYTALGHLHKPQNMKKTDYIVRYSGSPLKYSFDEVSHEKGVTLVEIDGAGNVEYRQQNLTPRRDLQVVTGTVDELQKAMRTENYILANLTDRGYVLNAIDRLRDAAFPNILGIEFVNLSQGAENFAGGDGFQEGKTVLDNFADFYKASTGEELAGEKFDAMKNFLAELEGEVAG